MLRYCAFFLQLVTSREQLKQALEMCEAFENEVKEVKMESEKRDNAQRAQIADLDEIVMQLKAKNERLSQELATVQGEALTSDFEKMKHQEVKDQLTKEKDNFVRPAPPLPEQLSSSFLSCIFVSLPQHHFSLSQYKLYSEATQRISELETQLNAKLQAELDLNRKKQATPTHSPASHFRAGADQCQS